MKHSLLALCAAILAAASPALANLPWPMLRELQKAGVPASAVSVEVREIGAARPLVQHQARKPMNPASTMKLLTTFAALDQLGPAYTWKTPVFHTGELRSGVLQGDLYVQGSGDPKVTYEALTAFLQQLRAKGLQHIAGDLVLDRSHFILPPHDPAAFDDEPMKAYNVGPDALLFNFKTVRFTFAPDESGQGVSVRAEPQPPALTIDNRLSLGGGPCDDWRDGLAARFESQAASASAGFLGRYAKACGEKSWWVSLFDHGPFFEASFREIWARQGGSLGGAGREGPVPRDARLLAALESPPLAEVIRDINKRSNNVMARQLFLTLAAPDLQDVASLPLARLRMEDWLRQKRLRFPEFKIENGSGLSRTDRISAAHLAEILQLAYASPVMPEFMASLPLAAIDGTLEHRMLGRVSAGMAHLKTGSLDDVRALAGYVLDRRGRRHVLVAIVNHPLAGGTQAALDVLVDWVVSRGLPPPKRHP